MCVRVSAQRARRSQKNVSDALEIWRLCLTDVSAGDRVAYILNTRALSPSAEILNMYAMEPHVKYTFYVGHKCANFISPLLSCKIPCYLSSM